MAQNWTDNCFESGHVGQTDLQNMENNFLCLKGCFSGTAAPSNPVAGMLWFDTSDGVLYQRNSGNTTWVAIWYVDDGVLPNNSVQTNSIQNYAVSSLKIANGAVGTSQLADLSVTEAKIANRAVTSGKIAIGAVGSSQIATGGIDTSNVGDQTITPSKLAPGVPICTFARETIHVGYGPYSTQYFFRTFLPKGTHNLGLVVHIRTGNGSYAGNARLKVGATTGAVCRYAGTSFAWYTANLDVSALANSYQTIEMQVYTELSAEYTEIDSFTIFLSD